MGAQEFYHSDIEDGAEVQGWVSGWVLKDGFRDERQPFLTRQHMHLHVGNGQVASGLEAALRNLHVRQPALVRMKPAWTKRDNHHQHLLQMPQGVDIELSVNISNVTHLSQQTDQALLSSARLRKQLANERAVCPLRLRIACKLLELLIQELLYYLTQHVLYYLTQNVFQLPKLQDVSIS